MLFTADLDASNIAKVLREGGFRADQTKADTVHVSSGSAYIWIYMSKPDEINPDDFEDEANWPIPRKQLRAVAAIMVRRNTESSALAIKIADELHSKVGGYILWNGMDYWEDLYNSYIAKKRSEC